ncbi:MAG: glycosyl hydrolase family 28 protein [Clostridiaceae bacterium]|nr:glycosyl hydrolase family 28 protein [Clostridiaceae bacterium]
MTRFDPNFYLDAASDAEMIQRAVDAAAETGEKVTIPRRNLRTGQDIWMIPQAVLLHSGSILVLDNCHLRQDDGVYDNLFRNANARTDQAKTRAGRQYDILIIGIGHAILDGGNHNGLVERNSEKDGRPHIIVNTMLHFHNCERVIVENLNILHQRWWGMTFHFCANSRVSNIRFMSIGNAPNADGVDLRTGCNGFVIENISGYTQDDTVALTCLDHGFDARMRVENMDDSIHNVIVRNITTAAMCAQVRLLNQDGRKLYNVLIENVQAACEIDPSDPGASEYAFLAPFSKDYVLESRTTWALEEPYWSMFRGDRRGGAGVRIGQDHYYKDNDPANRAKPGDTFNITVRNVQSSACFGVTLGCTLRDALIENVQTFGKSIMPVYFGPGQYDCIRIRDVGSAWNALPRPEDFGEDGGKQYGTSYGYDDIAAVYFNNAHVRGLTVDGVRANEFAKAVFAGRGCDVQLRARNVEMRGEETKLVFGDGIRADTEN